MAKQSSEITEADIQKAINYLQTNRSPEEATRENAIKLLQGMQITAHMIAHEKVDGENFSYRSYLMGANNITDRELLDLGIDIAQEEDSTSRKLIIPGAAIESYKELIRQKLDNGYWNDFVGNDLINFIFKMPDGRVIEYSYSDDNRLEIARLCTELNGDPIEKTSDLLDYLAENEFYTDEVKRYKAAH